MVNYSIIVKSNHWPKRIKRIKKIINLVLKKKSVFNLKKNIKYNLNFVLANDMIIKKFNKIYRKKNNSTDVLTFVSKFKNKFDQNEKYCDIIISAETLKKDAKKNNINFYDHITHLIVHSILHISGYKHQKNSDFNIMKNKEIKILSNLKISNPY